MPKKFYPLPYPIARRIVNFFCRVGGVPNINQLEARIHKKEAALGQMAKQQKALYRVISKIRASLDLETIFRTATKETCKLLGVERIAVYRFSEDWGGEFIGDCEFAEVGWDDLETLGKNTIWNDTHLQENQGGRYRNNENLVVADVYAAGLSQCHLEILEQFHIRAYATAPIFIGQKLWGVLAAYQHSQSHEWQDLEVQFLSQVATQLGFAVKQAELLGQTEQKAADLRAANEQQQILLNSIAEIRESLDLDTLFQTTVREVRRIMNADRVGIFKFDEGSDCQSGEFVAEDILPEFNPAIAVKVRDPCFAERYAAHYQQGRIQVISDVFKAGFKVCHLEILEQFQIKAKIVVHLIKGNRLWGLLCINQCGHPRHWKLAEVQFVKQLAAQFSVALNHAELLAQSRSQAEQLTQAIQALQQSNEKLEALTNLDALTQVGNRRFFDEVLEKEWLRLRRMQNHLSLILFDIDNFKSYNDRYGHPSGDECLIQVARASQRVLQRPADVLARYGGEEFAVILPETDGEGAIRVAKQIQDAIKQLEIPNAGLWEDRPFVTVSLGIVSEIPAEEKSVGGLIDRADAALYEAKAKGRDTWVCDGGDRREPRWITSDSSDKDRHRD
ncbi:sensor domain-containing diguanylate cyclase [Lusitaniella coriacea]|nr:diguanylate cyclase [Lusitaniella coriacea]